MERSQRIFELTEEETGAIDKYLEALREIREKHLHKNHESTIGKMIIHVKIKWVEVEGYNYFNKSNK